jgi:hypothetical protein
MDNQNNQTSPINQNPPLDLSLPVPNTPAPSPLFPPINPAPQSLTAQPPEPVTPTLKPITNVNQPLPDSPFPPINPAPQSLTAQPPEPVTPINPVAPVSVNINNRPQIAEKLKNSYNVLVTVNSNPTLDELTALLGLSLIFGKMKKHASAVFSGAVPSILEFLEPQKTIEKTTDSFQDFIIAIDKAKADKLKYKVEDNRVRIFITPYKTSISEDDLDFSLGDLNVDVIVALGVNKQSDLDQAISSHGRILHDATIIAISNTPEPTTIGSLNWVDTTTSSLSEMVTLLANDIGGGEVIDEQIATALLTGIVACTQRFSNEKTTPQSLSISSQLLSAGANQQLVADKLESEIAPPPPKEVVADVSKEDGKSDSGSGAGANPANEQTPVGSPSLIKSEKNEKKNEAEAEITNLGELDIDHTDDFNFKDEAERVDKIKIDQRGNLLKDEDDEEYEDTPTSEALAAAEANPITQQPTPPVSPPAGLPPITQQPTPPFSGHKSNGDSNIQNTSPLADSSPIDSYDVPSTAQTSNNNFMLSHGTQNFGPPPTMALPTADSLTPASNPIAQTSQTITPVNPPYNPINNLDPVIEPIAVASNTSTDNRNEEMERARQAINNLADPAPYKPPESLNALPLGEDVHPSQNSAPGGMMDMPLPTNLVPNLPEPTTSPTSAPNSSATPPPVPPPIINPLNPS